jgi:hypothetical protein
MARKKTTLVPEPEFEEITLRVKLGIMEGQVWVMFAVPVKSFPFDPDQCRQFARGLLEGASEIDGKPITTGLTG